MTCPTTAEAQTTREAAPAASWVGEPRLLVDAQIIGSLKKKRTLPMVTLRSPAISTQELHPQPPALFALFAARAAFAISCQAAPPHASPDNRLLPSPAEGGNADRRRAYAP